MERNAEGKNIGETGIGFNIPVKALKNNLSNSGNQFYNIYRISSPAAYLTCL